MQQVSAICVFAAALALTPVSFCFEDPNGFSEVPQLKGLKYRSIGPAWGGRVARAAGVPGDPSTYYAATAGGGVWKSTDGGITWKPVFDAQPVSSLGSLAIAASDPNVIYVGSGEANIRGNAAAGNGIYKTVDAGKNWTRVWKQEGQIGTLVVHPTNPDVAFAAVLGHAFGPNAERGVYRTTDGGKTWQQVLKKDENTGASDIALDPSNPKILFAGLWQARRYPWDMQSGGLGSGLYTSRDGGDTWTQIKDKGLPEGIWGKIGVAVAPSDPRRVYALIEAAEGGLFRSDDGGEKWTRVSKDRAIRQRAWYYSTLTVNPANPNEVWFPQVPMLRTIDGGKTLQYMPSSGRFAHGDHHDVWFDPKNPKRMIDANDGGVEVSTDGGETWFQPALPIAQFYHVSADNRVPYHVAGAMQDIGTAQGPSDSLSAAGINNTDWHGVGGGEAGHVVSDPADPNIVYAGEYGGIISFYDHRTGAARNVGAYPENPSGHGAEDLKYRFQWTAPIAGSPHDPKVIYHGGNVLFRTNDGGQTWQAISGDLTRNDKSKQKWAGGPITGDNTGVEVYCTIFAVAESPREKALIWAGSDDGLVHVTRDAGKTWKNVTTAMPGMPAWGTVSIIEPSHFDAGTAYVVVDNHRLDDSHPYLYKTTDYGASWTRLDATLPQDVYLHSVREDPTAKGLLYLGTERGVAYSNDEGKSWRSLRLNMPTVAVSDLIVKDDALVLATMGRSLWILDHLGPVRGMTPEVSAAPVYLFPAPATIAWNRAGRVRDRFSGDNPSNGAELHYLLKEPSKGEIKIEILDTSGAVIRTLSSTPETPAGLSDNIEAQIEAAKKAALKNEAGINVGVWDLRYKGAELIRNAKVDSGDPDKGPRVLPGTYTARLSVDGKTYTTPIKVAADPRDKATDAACQEQLKLALDARDAVSRITHMVNQLRSVKTQLAARNELLKDNPKAADLIKQSAALIEKVNHLEAELHNPSAEVVYDILAFQGGARLYSRIAYLYDGLLDGWGAPTQGMREVYADQKTELKKLDSTFKSLMDGDLNSANLIARKLDLPFIIVPDWSK
jgi:photosystem II stability/assembly factor-like uncharacterized protein